jgi:hypothetical protein
VPWLSPSAAFVFEDVVEPGDDLTVLLTQHAPSATLINGDGMNR